MGRAYFLVAFGGALGSMARFWCSGLVARNFGETFPWGTLTVNVIGSFVIGFFGGFAGPDGRVIVSTSMRQFVMIGLCGGYTTFSSFSFQTLSLARDGQWIQVIGNVFLSVSMCLLAVWAGYGVALGVNE